jgi:hypothetical protein
MRTASATAGQKSPVGHQPQWLEATYRALSRKRSNLQVGIGAVLPYDRCPVVATPKVLDVIAGVWLATKPVLDVLFGR